MDFENLTLERDGAIAVLTIARPHVLNALNTATLDELHRAALDVQRDTGLRALVLTGSGSKAFVAGADVSELSQLGPTGGRACARKGQQVFDVIENLGKPVVAAINGFALGGGCELAMACTIRIAASSAQLGQPEIHLGLMPGYGGTQRLPRLIGRGAALDLLLSGRRVSAEEALRLGLVNRVVPDADLAEEARRTALELAERAPVAVRCIMEAVTRGLDAPLSQAQALEAALFGVLAGTSDMREGTRAFLEKRKARFTGE